MLPLTLSLCILLLIFRLLLQSGDVEANPGPTLGSILTIDDLISVYKNLIKAAGNWFDLGIDLGLGFDILNNIKHQDNQTSLLEMLAIRLRTGPLTYSELCRSLRALTIRQDTIADAIEKECRDDNILPGPSKRQKVCAIEMTTEEQIFGKDNQFPSSPLKHIKQETNAEPQTTDDNLQHGDEESDMYRWNSRVPTPGCRKVWHTLKITTSEAILNAIDSLKSVSTQDLSIKRKFKKDREGLVTKWWFVINGDETILLELEKTWHVVEQQVGWTLGPVLRYPESEGDLVHTHHTKKMSKKAKRRKAQRLQTEKINQLTKECERLMTEKADMAGISIETFKKMEKERNDLRKALEDEVSQKDTQIHQLQEANDRLQASVHRVTENETQTYLLKQQISEKEVQNTQLQHVVNLLQAENREGARGTDDQTTSMHFSSLKSIEYPAITLDQLVSRVGIDMDLLYKECSDGHLRRMSSLLPDWLTYAKALGFTEPEIRDITYNLQLSNSTRAMKALRVLEKWHWRHAFNATYHHLIKVCLDLGHVAIATEICKMVKEHSSRPRPITGEKREATEHTEQGSSPQETSVRGAVRKENGLRTLSSSSVDGHLLKRTGEQY